MIFGNRAILQKINVCISYELVVSVMTIEIFSKFHPPITESGMIINIGTVWPYIYDEYSKIHFNSIEIVLFVNLITKMTEA